MIGGFRRPSTEKKHVFVKETLILNRCVYKHIHKNEGVQGIKPVEIEYSNYP